MIIVINSKLKLAVKMVLCFVGFMIMGQHEEILGQNEEEKSYTSAELNYISDAVFMGRKDSVTAPYLYPSFVYHHRSGFYAKGSFSYLTKPDDSRIDLFLLSSGIDFTFNKLYSDFSVTKYFFNEKSYNVISEVTVDITADLIYDFNVLNVKMAASTYFNKNSSSDFFLTLGLDHDFITSNTKFQFSPGLEVNWGSQNFYQEYYNKVIKGNRSGAMSGNPLNTDTIITIQENEKFNIMSVEFSLPMWYNYKAATFLFLPAFVLPQSEAKIIIDETLVEEQLKETFYWLIGLSYKL
jgi:hypothetical protein